MAATFEKKTHKNSLTGSHYFSFRQKTIDEIFDNKFSNLFDKGRDYRNLATISVLKDEEYTDKLINLHREFKKQKGKITTVSHSMATKKFQQNLQLIFKLEPDKIVLEITDDDSIFFTLVRDSYKIYIEYYLDDDTTMSILYENDKEINSFSGSINYAIEKTISILNTEDIVLQ